MTLFDLAGHLVSQSRSVVAFRAERCLHELEKDSPCMLCQDVCPAGAIEAGRPLQFDAQACQGCLACLPVCPTGAFAADDAVPEVLGCAARLDVPQLELICHLHPQPENGVSSESFGLVLPGCLAGLGIGAGMALASLGFERIIYRCDACYQCPWGGLFHEVQRQLAALQRLLAAWHKESVPQLYLMAEELSRRLFWDVRHPPVSRRDLFRLAPQPGKIAAAQSIVSVEVEDERQHGRERMRCLQAAAVLGEPKDSGVMLENEGFAAIAVNDDCIACGACVHICPTGALELEMDEEQGRYRLLHKTQYCIACGLCEHVCAPAVLQRSGKVRFGGVFRSIEPLLLQEGDIWRCERCGMLFAASSKTGLCPVCSYRRNNPFGVKMPPGVRSKIPDVTDM